MTCFTEVLCPNCISSNILKSGFYRSGQQRYSCENTACDTKTFMLEYRYKGCVPNTRKQIPSMTINGSGISDTSRVLKVSKGTVISVIAKQEDQLVSINPNIRQIMNEESGMTARILPACEEAEFDEQWSFVGNKSNQRWRWLWYAVDHKINTVLAYVFGRRKDEVFRKLKDLLETFGIQKFYTDDWGAYERNLDKNKHELGKRNTQKIERKNLNFRTWIKRLARKTLCFSKLEKMHDIVIGLLINKVEFGRDICV